MSLMTHQEMTHQKHKYTFTVLESHLDTFGHVNNATYLTLFEQARWDLIHGRGFGMDEIKESGLGPTILEANIKYKRELRNRQVITIETWCPEYKGKVGYVHQEMLNEKNEICAELKLTVALFDVKKRKLVNATPEWLKAIGFSEEQIKNYDQ